MTQYISPPFWHTADPDVRLWVPFNGNSTADISAYGQAVVSTSATVSGNQLTVVTGTTVQTLVYGPHASLAQTAAGWTLEAFFTWTSSDNFIEPGGDLKYTHTAREHNFHVFANAGKVALDTSDFGSPNAGPSAGNVLAGTGKVHVAMVRPAGAGAQTIACYVAGSQVFTFLETGAPGALTSGTVSVGKLGAGGNAVVAIDDVRFTLRELYTGASFTPPTSPL